MTYTPGAYGPWTCDDAGVVCDGFLINANLLVGPTCDGIGPGVRRHDHAQYVFLGLKLRR